MILVSYPEELDYVNAKRSEARGAHSFLDSFLNACLRADHENYELLRPVLLKLMVKYPARPERLAAERMDRKADAP